MDVMLKVATVAMVAVLCGAVLKKEAAEQAMLLTMVTGAVICFFLAFALEEIFRSLTYLAGLGMMEGELLLPVLKTVGISMCTKVTSELCRSANEGGMASFVELSGTVLALVVALPLLEGVIQMMSELL